MARIALYRKYRPQIFDDVVGQEHIQVIFRNSVKDGKVSHAYLFCGPRGVGKTSVARILAKAINCQKPKNGNPCNDCSSCRAIGDQTALDIIEIDAASNRGIDEIRELREKIKFSPSELKFKVFIIDEVHMLTKEAFNALLKTLEEPPSHAIFILATTEIHKIPATVISRCQRFDFKRIPEKKITEKLAVIATEEKVEIETEAIALISKISEGGMRDAISIFDQISTNYQKQRIKIADTRAVLGIIGDESTTELLRLLEKGDKKGTLHLTDDIVGRGADINQVTRNLMDKYRDKVKTGLADNESVESLIEIIEILADCSRHFRYSVYPQLSLEIALLKIIGLKKQKDNERPKFNLEKLSKGKKESNNQTILTDSENDKSLASKWSQVLFEIKTKNLSIHALVKVAAPTFGTDEIILTFPFKFHRERIDERKNREIVEKAVKKIYGCNFRIICALGNGNFRSEVIEAPLKEKAVKSEVEGETVSSENILDIFGGKLVE